MGLPYINFQNDFTKDPSENAQRLISDLKDFGNEFDNR